MAGRFNQEELQSLLNSLKKLISKVAKDASDSTKIAAIGEQLNRQIFNIGYESQVDSKYKDTAVKLLAAALFIAANSGFDNDKSLSEEYSLDKNSSDNLLEFGYRGVLKTIVSVLAVDDPSRQDELYESFKTSNNLLSHVRNEVNADNYIKGGYFDKDLRVIQFLVTPQDNSKLNKKMVDIIAETDFSIGSTIQTYKEAIISVYKDMFSANFGVKPYFGVLGIHSINNNGNVQTICALRVDACTNNISTEYRKYDSYFRPIAKYLLGYNNGENKLGVITQDTRNFNINAVIESADHGNTLYFQNKLLEVANICKCTINQDAGGYEPYTGMRRLDTYIKEGGFTNFIDSLINEVVCRLAKDTYQLNNESSILSDLENRIASANDTDQFKDEIASNLKKLVRSLCKIVIISDFKLCGDTPVQMAIKVADLEGKLSGNKEECSKMFQPILSAVSSSEKNFDEPIISKVKGVSILGSEAKIIEYKYVFNAELSSIEPLFMYTAVDIFKQTNQAINWGSVLFGEDLKGDVVQAGNASNNIKIGSHVVHNIFAGSRSGKGLLTMTLSASALASGRALFYVDRKPDMASLFAELSNGNMFVVDGGEYDFGKDTFGKFSADRNPITAAVNAFNNSYANFPQYLLKTESNKQGIFNEGDVKSVWQDCTPLNDYAYWRAMMFCFAIEHCRIYFSKRTDANSISIYNKLGGTDGVVFIFDETTNWIAKFEQKYMSNESSSFFSQDGTHTLKQSGGVYKSLADATNPNVNKEQQQMLEKKITDAREAVRKDKAILKGFEDAGDTKEAEKASKGLIKSKANLADLEQTYVNTFGHIYDPNTNTSKNPLQAYCTQLFEKITETYDKFSTYKNAGFHTEPEESRVDMFVLGQTINTSYPITYNGTESLYTWNGTAATFVKPDEGKNASLFKTILSLFYNDTFLGANLKEQDEAHFTPIMCEYVHENKKWWLYRDEATPNNALKKEGGILFRPYLVLNTSKEELGPSGVLSYFENTSGYEVSPEASFLNGVGKNVIKSGGARGEKLWTQIRRKHVSRKYAEMSDEEKDKTPNILNEGIGFLGLINDVASTNKDAQFNLDQALGKSKAIADYVAQACGYNDYWEFIYDFRPEGIFSVEDVLNALINPGSFVDYKKRLPIIANIGMFSDGSTGDDSADEMPEDELNGQSGIDVDAMFDGMHYDGNPNEYADPNKQPESTNPTEPDGNEEGYGGDSGDGGYSGYSGDSGDGGDSGDTPNEYEDPNKQPERTNHDEPDDNEEDDDEEDNDEAIKKYLLSEAESQRARFEVAARSEIHELDASSLKIALNKAGDMNILVKLITDKIINAFVEYQFRKEFAGL